MDYDGGKIKMEYQNTYEVKGAQNVKKGKSIELNGVGIWTDEW